MKIIKNLKIGTKIAVVIAVLMVITLVVVGVISYTSASNALFESYESSLITQASQTAQIVQDELQFVQIAMSQIAEDLSNEFGDNTITKELLSSKQQELGYIYLGYTSANGTVLSTEKRVADISEEEGYKKALEGDFTFDSPEVTEGDNQLYIPAFAPVTNSQGTVLGVLTAFIPYENVSSIVSDITIGETGYAILLDETGTMIAHSVMEKVINKENPLEMAKSNPALAKLAAVVQKCINRETGFDQYLYEGIVKYMSYAPIENSTWAVLLAVPKSELFVKIDQQLRATIISSAIALAVIMAMLLLFVRFQISKPLKTTADFARALASGELDAAIKIKSHDEVGQLSNTLDKEVREAFQMIENNRVISEKQSEYQAEQVDKLVVNLERLSMGELHCDMQVSEPDEDTRQIYELFSKISGNLHESVNAVKSLEEQAEMFLDNVLHGKLDYRSKTDELNGSYKMIMNGFNKTVNTIVDKLELIPSPIMFMDKDLKFTYVNEKTEKLLGKSRDELYGKKCASAWKTEACNTPECPCTQAMKNDSVMFSDNTCSINGKNMDLACIGAPVKDENGEMLGAFEFVTDQTEIRDAMRVAAKQSEYQKTEVEKLVGNLQKLSEGSLSCDMVVDEPDKDTKELYALFTNISDNLHKSVNTIKSYVTEISYILGEMSGGNLKVGITSEYQGDFVELKSSINTIIESLSETLLEINTAADQVSTGATQVSDGNQEVSQGATEQASSIEELSSSITEMAEQIKKNAENASTSTALAEQARGAANDGNEKMKGMLDAMEEINESSNNISKIIKVIDDIAFQTNILALNAAVEAARAGAHGKGFAVVAEEVRNLAARSANAANETTAMIEGSIKKVEAGTAIATETADALSGIVTGAEESVKIMNEIANASNEQATGVAQINRGIEQLSQVVQTNSATAEEGAAASEELSSQAALLTEMINRFQIDRDIQRKGMNNHTARTAKRDDTHEPINRGNGKPKIVLNDSDFGKY